MTPADAEALTEHLRVHAPYVREDLDAELALTAAGAVGAVYVAPHDAQVWLHGGADREERALVLAAAHDAINGPTSPRWQGCWRALGDGAWLLWIFVAAEGARAA